MKHTIEAFETCQEEVLGHIRFRVRGKVNEYCVDAYTPNGLCTGTKLGRVSEEVVREWMSKVTHELMTTQEIHNVHSD